MHKGEIKHVKGESEGLLGVKNRHKKKRRREIKGHG